jgi:hypothetical protein
MPKSRPTSFAANNALQGKDRAVQSLRLLGMDRRCNLFARDSVVGQIVLTMPTATMSHDLGAVSVSEPTDVVDGDESTI